MIRIGLVGCGHIGMVHAVALQQLGNAGLVDAGLTATFDDDADRAVRMARRHGGEPAPSLDALLDAVDAVWVCTWTAGHLAAVEAAAERDVAVFCEKPLATDLANATRVAAALERVPHQVGLVLRFSPVFRELGRRLASGAHGPVLSAVLRNDQYFPVQGLYGSTWRGDVLHAGGGTLIEHSIHDVDLLRLLLGNPIEVSGRTASRFGFPGIEDTAVATLVQRDGSIAQLVSVWHQVLSRESSRRFEVFCEKAMLWTDDDNLGPLHVVTDDGEQIVELEPPAWSTRFDLPEIYRKPLAPYAEAAKAFLDDLPRLRSSGEPDRSGAGRPRAADALAAHRIVDLVYRSAAGGGQPRSALGESAGEAG
jgi:myo-inositol 2-dehydrogenase / D-chiro-inositol 1-dehydrogenase